MILQIKDGVHPSLGPDDKVLMRDVDITIDLQMFVENNPSLGLTADQIEIVEDA